MLTYHEDYSCVPCPCVVPIVLNYAFRTACHWTVTSSDIARVDVDEILGSLENKLVASGTGNFAFLAGSSVRSLS